MQLRFVAAAVLCTVAFTSGAPAVSANNEIDRLTALGRLWAYVKYAHPQVALGQADWDAAVLQAIPAAKAAADDAAFARVVNQMLGTLNDPETRVRLSPKRPTSTSTKEPLFTIDGDRMTLRPSAASTAQEALKQLNGDARLAAVRSVIVDLRGANEDVAPGIIEQLFVTERLQLPALRGATVTPFERSVTSSAATFVEPSRAVVPRRSVFVVDGHSPVPGVVYLLRSSRVAQVVCAGESPDAPAELRELFGLPGEFVAQIRVADYTIGGKPITLGCDARLPAEANSGQVSAAATALFEQPVSAVPVGADPLPVDRPEIPYGTPAYPDEPHRILAVYRLWAAVNYLSAYTRSLDRPWADALPEFVARASAAPDELEYVKAIAAMGAWLHDGHLVVPRGSDAFSRWMGGGQQPPFQLQFFDGRAFVVRLLGDDPHGAAIGDEVLEIDGQSIAERIARVAPYGSFSTPGQRDMYYAVWITGGEHGKPANLKVRRNGRVISVTTLPRDPSFRPTRGLPRTGDAVSILDGNIGYMDLDRLEAANVDAAFERVKDTKGIIFDMRGYPRLSTPQKVFAKINRNGANPDAGNPFGSIPAVASGYVTRFQYFGTGIEPAEAPPVYTRPIVVLINEVAQSAAETTAINLKRASNAIFVGSRTVGADGETKLVPLPGGISVRFTANEVRLPDGGQLQRVGLKPDIEVRPTIAGIKTGRDEVLERAERYLATGK